MAFSVQCSCGRSLPVSAAAAGSSITCDCGRSVPVPRLSELRQAAGQGAFEAGIIDRVRRMVAAGELPSDRRCLLTGAVTDDTLDVLVECERRWLRGPGKGRWCFAILTILLLPFSWLWALLGWAILDEKHEQLGYDRVVRVPLRVCRTQHGRAARFSQRRLRRLLALEPACATLLEEYPGARVQIAMGSY